MLKSDKVLGWDRSRLRPGCPHSACLDKTSCDAAHIYWECPAVERVWLVIRENWRHLSEWQEELGMQVILDAVFGLTLPALGSRFWEMPAVAGAATSTEGMVTAYAVVNEMWTAQVMAGMQTIQAWRGAYSAEEGIWEDNSVQFRLRKGLDRIMHDMQREAAQRADTNSGTRLRVLAAARQAIRLRPLTLQEPRTDELAVIFFDGGSRGNPGAGGSGAVMVATQRQPVQAKVVWAGSMSHANRRTTNNVAEYQGLLCGLRAALAQGRRQIHVVGDSNLVLTQMSRYRVPKNERLRRLYLAARMIADKVGMVRWSHHYRHHNKMADFLANQAMDFKSSAQDIFPTGNEQLRGVSDWMGNDFEHWAATWLE